MPSAVAVAPEIRRLTAVHEAAHAVVAHLNGLRVDLVEMIGDRELAGSCHTLELFARTAEADPRIGIDVALAGPLAEAREMNAAEPDEDAADLDRAVRLALALTGDCGAAQKLLAERAEAVCALLHTHWAVVDGIARALERRGRLGAAELEALLAALIRD